MNTHNDKEINANELFDFLDSISKFIEIPIKMYALGGTALTILGIKNSTRDIDVNIESNKEYKYICNIFKDLNFEKTGIYRWITQEGLAFDMFYGSNILGTELLEDCIVKSKFTKQFENIKLYTLPLEDIIISKLARGSIRDFDDIKSILDNKEIDINFLIHRYKETMETSTVANIKQKLLDLIEIKFNEWNIKISKDMIEQVQKW